MWFVQIHAPQELSIMYRLPVLVNAWEAFVKVDCSIYQPQKLYFDNITVLHAVTSVINKWDFPHKCVIQTDQQCSTVLRAALCMNEWTGQFWAGCRNGERWRMWQIPNHVESIHLVWVLNHNSFNMKFFSYLLADQ